MYKFRLLLITAICAVMTACGGADKNAPAGKTAGCDSLGTTINIRYVSMDSIYKNYVLAQNISQQAQNLANDLQAYQAQLSNNLQQRYNQIQQKAQSNQYLSQASYENDLKELEKTNTSYQNLYAKREQNAAMTMDARQKELHDSIQNFIEAYNGVHHYDAILIRDAGLYYNPELDITDEVIEGLNTRYKGEKTAGATTADPLATPTGNLKTTPSPATINAPDPSSIAPKK